MKTALRAGARRIGLAAALLAGFAGAAAADPPAPDPFSLRWAEAAGAALLERDSLTGSWGGLRDTLQRIGITPAFTFVTDVLGNPVGGLRRGLRETDELGAALTVDLERLAGWTGAQFHLSLSSRSGTSLSTDDVGNVFNVAQLCCGHTYRLVDVALEQSLWDDRLNVRAGRIATGDDFLASPLYGAFVQSGFNGNPAGVFVNLPAVTNFPFATWGARARVTPIDPLYVMAGVYNNDPTLAENDKHGADWSMRGPVFAIAEIGFRLNQEAGATGLPGNYKLGGFYQSGSFPDLYRDAQGGSAALSGLPPRLHQGNGGFYILLDQMIHRVGGPGSRRGLTPFVSLLFSPDQDINPMPFFANAGLVYQGPIARRPRDVAAFGVVYGGFSEQLQRAQRDAQRAGSGPGPQRYELALELTYIIQATPWLQIQPDLQYIINPGGTGTIRDALVIGFQLAINL